MKQFARSVPAGLFLSGACLSLIALAGCGSSGSGNLGPQAAKNIYALQHTGEPGTNEQDSVLVFSASATGSTTPTSTLTLPTNFISLSVAVGPTGTIYVGGLDDGLEGGQILEYAAGASGSASPTVTLNGSNTQGTTFIIPTSLAVSSTGTLFVSSIDGSLEAFASGFTSSSAPSQYLTWGEENFDDYAEPIGVDTAGDVFYLDDDAIDVFAAGATGSTAPVRQITGTNTTSFDDLEYMAVDGAGDVYVANYNSDNDPNDNAAVNPKIFAAYKNLQAKWPRSASHPMARPHVPDVTYEPTGIIEFAAGAASTQTSNPTPTKRISGASATTNLTKIVEPYGLAVDAAGNLYYADANGGYESDANLSVLLEVFSPSATGNVAPVASITSTNYTYWFNGPPFPTTSVAIR